MPAKPAAAAAAVAPDLDVISAGRSADVTSSHLCTMYVGPKMYERYDWSDICPPAKYYMRRKIGPPGGAICVNATNLASCKRFD